MVLVLLAALWAFPRPSSDTAGAIKLVEKNNISGFGGHYEACGSYGPLGPHGHQRPHGSLELHGNDTWEQFTM